MIIAKKSHYFSQLSGGLLIKNTHSNKIKKKIWHDFNVQRHHIHLIMNPTRGYVKIALLRFSQFSGC